MKTRIRTYLILAVSAVTAAYALYRLFFRLLEKALIKTRPAGLDTPSVAGLVYEELAINSGKRRLQAWFVPAAGANDAKKAVLIFHGIDETIADWIPALGYLHEQGCSALVFDYSGFGNSQGQAMIANMRQDARAAYAAFLSKIPGDLRQKIVLGYSLGSGVLLEAIPNFPIQPDLVAVAAAYSSGRDAAVRVGGLPALLAFLIPDIFNNVEAVRRINRPLLVIHSRDDELFPVWMPEKIIAAASGPKRLVWLEGPKHGDMLEGRAAEYLAPLREEVSWKPGPLSISEPTGRLEG